MTELINDGLEVFSEWLCINGLKFNVPKTKCKFLSSRHKMGSFRDCDINVVIESSRIKVVNMFKYLGAMIDNTFNFVPHVNVLCKKRKFFLTLLPVIYRYTLNILFLVLSYFLIFSFVNHCYFLLAKMSRLQKLHYKMMSIMFKANTITLQNYNA